jgi:hypothetical protein
MTEPWVILTRRQGGTARVNRVPRACPCEVRGEVTLFRL